VMIPKVERCSVPSILSTPVTSDGKKINFFNIFVLSLTTTIDSKSSNLVCRFCGVCGVCGEARGHIEDGYGDSDAIIAHIIWVVVGIRGLFF